MRLLILVITIIFFGAGEAQTQVLSFDHGKVEFHTSNIMSDIEAESKVIDARLDIQTGQVDISIPISSFEFEYEMMQDHFNEEYLESEKYPKASFKGQITQDITAIETSGEVNITGDLSIHGVTKAISFTATLSQQDGFTRVKCVFPIVFKDFNVEEPSILSKAIAKDVEFKGVLYLK